MIRSTVEPTVSNQPNVKSRWSLTGDGCLREVRPFKIMLYSRGKCILGNTAKLTSAIITRPICCVIQ